MVHVSGQTQIKIYSGPYKICVNCVYLNRIVVGRGGEGLSKTEIVRKKNGSVKGYTLVYLKRMNCYKLAKSFDGEAAVAATKF